MRAESNTHCKLLKDKRFCSRQKAETFISTVVKMAKEVYDTDVEEILQTCIYMLKEGCNVKTENIFTIYELLVNKVNVVSGTPVRVCDSGKDFLFVNSSI